MWTRKSLRLRYRFAHRRPFPPFGVALTLVLLGVAVGIAIDHRLADGAAPAAAPIVYLGAGDMYESAPRNCGEARTRGLRNIPRGSPYYAPWLDADDDGIACEPWLGRWTSSWRRAAPH
ncbi:MAG: excalibur calcium-binding domain-containing protein [Acetobacteraceae bacterium]